MSQFDDSGPAFPHSINESGTAGYHGLTKRQWLAGLAMNGYLAGRNSNNRDTHKDMVARTCCEYADALIAELAKEKPV